MTYSKERYMKIISFNPRTPVCTREDGLIFTHRLHLAQHVKLTENPLLRNTEQNLFALAIWIWDIAPDTTWSSNKESFSPKSSYLTFCINHQRQWVMSSCTYSTIPISAKEKSYWSSPAFPSSTVYSPLFQMAIDFDETANPGWILLLEHPKP